MTEQDVKDINGVIQFTNDPEHRYCELELIISDCQIKHKNLKYEIGRKRQNDKQTGEENRERGMVESNKTMS